jgi:hypothetical protein
VRVPRKHQQFRSNLLIENASPAQHSAFPKHTLLSGDISDQGERLTVEVKTTALFSIRMSDI